jgi:hypothetical protein
VSAVSANRQVLSCCYCCDRINVSSENPDLRHVAGLSVATVKRQDDSKGFSIDRREPFLKNETLGFSHCGLLVLLVGAEDLNSAHSKVIHKFSKVTGRQVTGERSQDTIGIAGVLN